ncbi:unnamed protein product [Amoebophrya sp. A120]|nr:unnamed protein product [Amoebophrya sp. A120]|eukprot:GSA120T00025078001.1
MRAIRAEAAASVGAPPTVAGDPECGAGNHGATPRWGRRVQRLGRDTGKSSGSRSHPRTRRRPGGEMEPVENNTTHYIRDCLINCGNPNIELTALLNTILDSAMFSTNQVTTEYFNYGSRFHNKMIDIATRAQSELELLSHYVEMEAKGPPPLVTNTIPSPSPKPVSETAPQSTTQPVPGIIPYTIQQSLKSWIIELPSFHTRVTKLLSEYDHYQSIGQKVANPFGVRMDGAASVQDAQRVRHVLPLGHLYESRQFYSTVLVPSETVELSGGALRATVESLQAMPPDLLAVCTLKVRREILRLLDAEGCDAETITLGNGLQVSYFNAAELAKMEDDSAGLTLPPLEKPADDPAEVTGGDQTPRLTTGPASFKRPAESTKSNMQLKQLKTDLENRVPTGLDADSPPEAQLSPDAELEEDQVGASSFRPPASTTEGLLTGSSPDSNADLDVGAQTKNKTSLHESVTTVVIDVPIDEKERLHNMLLKQLRQVRSTKYNIGLPRTDDAEVYAVRTGTHLTGCDAKLMLMTGEQIPIGWKSLEQLLVDAVRIVCGVPKATILGSPERANDMLEVYRVLKKVNSVKKFQSSTNRSIEKAVPFDVICDTGVLQRDKPSSRKSETLYREVGNVEYFLFVIILAFAQHNGEDRLKRLRDFWTGKVKLPATPDRGGNLSRQQYQRKGYLVLSQTSAN